MNDIPDEIDKFQNINLDIDETIMFNVKYKKTNNKKCIIWLPGRNDYFYHYHISSKLHNYDLYALNYRNCHPLKCDLSDYIDDIKKLFKEIDIIYEYFNINSYDEVILYGHSTGGLICTLYQFESKNKISKIILNAPWFHYKFNTFDHYIFHYLYYYIIPCIPEFDLIERSFNDNKYMTSLTEKFKIDKLFKKNYITPVISTWFRNIIKYQNNIYHKKIWLKYPTLALISDHNAEFKGAKKGDEILDINEHIKQLEKLGNNKLVLIKDATHDVLCSHYDYAIDQSLEEIKNFLN